MHVCLRTHARTPYKNRSLLKSVEKQKSNQLAGSRHILASCVDTLAGKEERNLTRKVKQAHSGSRAVESSTASPLQQSWTLAYGTEKNFRRVGVT